MARVAKETASVMPVCSPVWVTWALLLRVRGESWLETKPYKLAKECLCRILPLTCENIH